MEFRYIARDYSGNRVEGVMEAESSLEVAKALREEGLFPLVVKPVRRFDLSSLDVKRIFGFLTKPRLKDVVIFTRQLAAMVGAGIPLPSAIGAISQQMGKKHFKEILEDIKNRVEEGVKFSQALLKYQNIFGDLYISMVEAGETTGELDLMLTRWALFAEKVLELRRKVRNAMIYPAVVLVFAIGVLFLLLVKVVPSFTKIFKESGVQLPGLTAFVISFSNFVRVNLHFIILGFIAFFILFRLALRNEKFKYYWDTLKLRFPIVGPIFRKVAVARFARTLSTMVKSGVSILDSIENVAKTSGNVVIEKALLEIRDDVARGDLLSDTLRKTQVFPPMVIEMVAAGERTGSLDSMLEKVAEFFEAEVDSAVAALTTILEPIMLILLGGMVGTIVIALYLPIFKLASTVR